MKKTDILLRVIDNLLDENKRLRAEMAELKKVELCPKESAFINSLIPKVKVRVERSRIVNDPTDMIREAQDMIEKIEEYQRKQK